MLIINIVLAIIIALVLVFVFKRYIVTATDIGVKIIFILSAVIAIVGLFYRPAFTYLAEQSLVQIGTKAAIQSLDRRIMQLDPRNALDGLGGLFGIPNGSEDEIEIGYLENEIYPGIVSGLALIYRILAVVICVVLMGVCIYLNYATFGARRVIVLEEKIRRMENKLAMLEESST